MLDKFFRLSENNTTVRIEILAGATTFLTMAYIIFVQPAVLSGSMFGFETGMDFGAVTTATCLAAALATAIMALYARFPIAQAPGVGENFFFVFTVIPAAAAAGYTNSWQVALGVVFIAGVIFLLLSIIGLRQMIIDSVSPSMKNGIAVGIGLFIAFIGLQNTGLIIKDPGTAVKLNTDFASPDLIIFFVGLFLTGALHIRKVRGSIFWGIIGATALAIIFKLILPLAPALISESSIYTESVLNANFQLANKVADLPPSLAPTFFKMDLKHALTLAMLPSIIIFLFMDIFDTVGTLIGVSEQAGFIKDNKLPRAEKAMLSDAVGTVAGACLGTSTVTSFVESAAGVEQGGRTGLTSLTTAVLFILALFFAPIIAMVGSYPSITAPALVIVGSMMLRNITKLDWNDYSEFIPAFMIMIGIPLTYSILDGIALGFISFALLKLFSGRIKECSALMYIMAGLFILRYIFL